MNFFSRRRLLSNTARVAAAAFVPPIANAGRPDAPFPHQPLSPKLKVIVTGGHPGDPEYGCGGTIARYSDLGHEVVLLYLNRGEWPETSAADDKSVRVTEARNACEILKARPAYVGQIDGRAIVDQAHYDQFHRL